MSRSYPYNIILTRSKQAVNQLFFNKYNIKKTFKDLATTLSEAQLKQTFIVSPTNNNGFLSMEINFPTQSPNSKNYVVIKLLESSKLLETFPEVGDTPEDTILRQRLITSSKHLTDDELNSIALESNQYYLSYGVGDDLDTWSGPYILTLLDVDISITEQGVRQLELFFSPTTNSLKAFSERALDDSRYATLGSSFDSVVSKERTLKASQKIIPDKSGKRLAKDQFRVKLPDWNHAVRYLLTDYIGKIFSDVPFGNILVVFDTDLAALPTSSTPAPINPDLGSVKSLNDFKPKLSKFGIDLVSVKKKIEYKQEDEIAEPLGPPIPIQEGTEPVEEELKVLNSEDLQVVRAAGTKPKIEVTGSEPRSTRYSPIVNAKGEQTGVEATEYYRGQPGYQVRVDFRKQEQAQMEGGLFTLENMNRVLGNDTRNVPGPRSLLRTPSTDKPVMGPPIPTVQYEVKIIKDRRVGSANPDKSDEQPDLDEHYETFYELIMAFNSGDGGKTLLDPLFKFYEGIKSVDNPDLFVIFEENDRRILKLLKHYGMITHEDRPVILFGDKTLIGQLVYGRGTTLGRKKSSGREYWNHLLMPSIDQWKYYKADFKGLFDRFKSNSSFGESTDLGKLTKRLKKYLDYNAKEGDIIFTHNVTNSNVLSVNFTNSGYKAVYMNLGADSYTRSVASNLRARRVTENSNIMGGLEKVKSELESEIRSSLGLTEGDGLPKGEKLLAEVIKYLASEEGKSNLFLAKTAERANVLDLTIEQFITLMILMFGGQSLVEPIKIMTSPGNVATEYSDTLKRIRKYTINATVKTLPFFNHMNLFQSPCYLFGAQNDVIGSPIRGDDKLVPSVFTGRYLIAGVKHVMSRTDAYSEFILIKNELDEIKVSKTLREYFKSALEEVAKRRKKEEEERAARQRETDQQQNSRRSGRPRGFGQGR
jgi:hypothetical protein